MESRKKQNHQGFTLIELLISMFIILSVTSLVMAIFVAGLRGSSRASVEMSVRQNGSLALAQVARMIRNSKSFDGVSSDGSTNFTTDVCYVSPGFGPTPTPQAFKAVRMTAFDGGVSTIACPEVGETSITSKSATLASPLPLTDTTTVAVLPNSCYFTCQQSTETDSPIVGITFRLESLKVGGVVGQTVGQTFQTLVIPRNFVR